MIRTQSAPAALPGMVERMAERMREMGNNGVAVTADSLAEHSDFTRSEIAAFAPAAADLAKSLSRAA